MASNADGAEVPEDWGMIASQEYHAQVTVRKITGVVPKPVGTVTSATGTTTSGGGQQFVAKQRH